MNAGELKPGIITRGPTLSEPVEAFDGNPLRLPTPAECRDYIQAARKGDPALDRLLTLCATQALDATGAPVQLQPVGVSVEVGALIYWLAKRYPALSTVDSGFGYGVAASFFALARGSSSQAIHYSFDCHLDWTHGVGIRLLDELGVRPKVQVEEQVAHVGIANLYTRTGAGTVGLALLDGTVLFDELMADFAAVERLFKCDEGILLVARSYLPQVRAFISFLQTNRKFRITQWSDDLVVAERLPGARRPWFHFEPFSVPLENNLDTRDGELVEIIAPDRSPLVFANEPGHQYHLRRVLQGHEYPPLLPDVFQATSILDVGAHVGCAARFFANQYPDARIICIEPTPESFELLCRNTAHLSAVERHNVAFASQAGEIRMWRGQNSSGQNSASPNEANCESYFDVPAVEPLRFCLEHGLNEISILKIDIEGLEMDVLRALQPLLGKVQVIYAEYHSENLRRQIDDLLRAGFTLFSSTASEAYCGTVCYAASELLVELLSRTHVPRHVFAKKDSRT